MAKKGDTNNIEFKRELNDKFEKEVVSFLNSNGGHIYIGINDDGSVYGVNNVDEVQLEIKDRFKNKIAPSSMGLFEIIVEKKEKKNIIHVIIASGNEKPYYIKKYGMSPQGAYIRVGSSCTQLTEKQIFDFYTKRTRTSLTNIISPTQKLTFTQLEIYYSEKGYKFTDNTFSKLNFLLDDNNFNYLAYLLSDQNSLVINVGKFKEDNVIDLVEVKSYSNQSLIKTTHEIIYFIENQNIVFTTITASTLIEKKLFDSVATKEAITNTLVHSDYSYENTPTFRIFDDHMEIISVGGLPEGFEKDEFLNGYMSPKNPQLMKIFRDLGIVEHMGTGIIRILSKYDKSIFTFTPNFIKVSIPFYVKDKKPVGKKEDVSQLTKRQNRIIELIKENLLITQGELADYLGVSRYSIIRDIKKLEEKGLVKKVGSNKNGTWEIMM